MTTVRVSRKYQIVIPKKIREEFGIRPGQQIDVLYYNGTISLIPIQPMESMRGFLKGMSSDVPRDEEDRV